MIAKGVYHITGQYLFQSWKTHTWKMHVKLPYHILLLSLFDLFVDVDGAICPPTPPATRAISRLRQNILCDYDKASRPVKNSNDTVPLRLTFHMHSIDMVRRLLREENCKGIPKAQSDEHKESMFVEGVFRFMWVDQFISWKPWEYEGLTYLKVDEAEVWVPDLTINLMNLKGAEEMKPSSCIASFTGNILCLPKVSVIAPCQQDMRHWPYDQHNCSFMLSSYMYYEHQLNFTAMEVDGKELKNSRLWEMLKFSVERKRMNFTMGPPFLYYPYAEISFTIRRQSSFFAAATVLPAILMLCIVLSTFWMGPQCTTRILTCGFIMLGCITFLSYLLYLIPVNGGTVPVIVTLFRDCLALAFFGILTASLRLNLESSMSKPPAWVSSITDRLELSIVGRLLLITDTPTSRDDETAIIDSSPAKTSLWLTFIVLTDRLGFVISSLVSLVLLMGYLP